MTAVLYSWWSEICTGDPLERGDCILYSTMTLIPFFSAGDRYEQRASVSFFSFVFPIDQYPRELTLSPDMQ